jgi:hypothetical protein
VKMKISVCPTNPAWKEWECMAHGRNLSDTVQKAALEALTTFSGKHPAEIVNSAAKVIPVPERHIAPGGERETILPAQSNSHYSPDLVTLVASQMKKDGKTFKRGTDAYPTPARDDAVTTDQWGASPLSPLAQSGRPRRCATIPSAAAPSPALWKPRTTRCRHACRCATSSPPSAQRSS